MPSGRGVSPGGWECAEQFCAKRFLILCWLNPSRRKRPKIKPSNLKHFWLGLILGFFRLNPNKPKKTELNLAKMFKFARFNFRPFSAWWIKPTTQHRIKNLFAQNCSAHSQLLGDTPLPLGIRRVKLNISQYYCKFLCF